MPFTVKYLREQLREPARAIQALRDALHARNEGKPQSEWQDFSAEEKAAWDRANADYNAISRQIEIAEQGECADAVSRLSVADPVIGRTSQPGRGGASATDAHRALALQAWFRAQLHEDLTLEQEEACHLVGLNPARPVLTMPLLDTFAYRDLQQRFCSVHPSMARQNVSDFRATLTMGSGPGGGYLVPPETLIRQLEINMLAFGGVRQVADPLRTTTGERMSWPTADDTSNTGAQLGESVSIGSSVDPTFGKVYWDAYKFSSKPILVPYELLQDSFVNLPLVLGDMLGERLGRITNTKFTTGTGAATPKGIVTAATAFSAASATAIAADDILGLIHSVDPAYRMGAGFMSHDAILLHIRKLKDGSGQYLWQTGMQMGVPDRIFGYALTNNQDMDSTVASGKKTLLFGQLSKYKIRTVGSVRLYRLEERYRDTDQDAFIAFTREDGNLLTAGTAPIRYLSH